MKAAGGDRPFNRQTDSSAARLPCGSDRALHCPNVPVVIIFGVPCNVSKKTRGDRDDLHIQRDCRERIENRAGTSSKGQSGGASFR